MEQEGVLLMTSRMTATDELRRLLDERGVEYEGNKDVTRFFGYDGFEVVMQEDIDGKLDCLTPLYLTPEQAIEATLGRGTCRDLAETPEYRDKTEFKCSECGYEYSAVGGFGCDCGDEPDFRYCPSCGRKVVDA